MPSGAKKRKAAKKKLQKEVRNNNTATNFDGSLSLGTDNAKSHDERESDGGEGERESSEEPVVNSHAEAKEEVSLGEQIVAEFSKGEKTEVNYSDVLVNAEEDDVRETKNGEHKISSSSSSSSSSEDYEVEKEKPVVVEAGEVEQQVPSSVSEASRENPVITEVAYGSVEESIPVEESVKQVVSLPHESNVENESGAAENPVISYVESEMKVNLDEVVPSADEKHKDPPEVTNFVEEKIETKVIQVVGEGSQKLAGVIDMSPRDGEGLLPQSSGVTSADASCGDSHVKESETHKYVEEQPLISSAPLPVRGTSWTNCCGLFEVFSGGASR